MTQHHGTPSPYEVLGAARNASEEQLRRAYRRALRRAHPDTGGDASSFAQVQAAWQILGTAQARARYDRGGPVGAGSPRPARPAGSGRPTQPRPSARSFGHPGGWRRERYLALLHEWVGLGDPIPDPYDLQLVDSAPESIRRLLAGARAEEATARALSSLDAGWTIWHDVALDPRRADREKLDHLVLGPVGLIALQSEDFGTGVRLLRGELAGEGLRARRPLRELATRARGLRRAVGMRADAAILVPARSDFDEAAVWAGAVRGIPTGVARVERVVSVLRNPIPGVRPIDATTLFDIRTRLQETVTFV